MAESQLTVIKRELSTPGWLQQVKAAVPAHVKPEQFIRTAQTMLSQNPNLVKCERNSLYSAIMSCAALGLMPESFLGQAYVVPYKGQAQLQIGYKGLIALARRSGDIGSIESGVTYENDEVELILGDESKFTIRPCLDGDPGQPKFVWCVITLKDGSKQREIMTVEQVEKIRKAAPSANSPAWKNNWDGMARKVCIKRALKYAPLSTDIQQATSIDDAPETGVVVNIDGEDLVTTPVGDGPGEPQVVEAKKEPAKRKSRMEQMAEEAEDAVTAPADPPEQEAGEVV